MDKTRMREVVESGFKITVPEDTSFRLYECHAYQGLSGLSLKEIDVGWWDARTGKLTLLELKGQEIWHGLDKSEITALEHLVTSLKGKLTDALLMLAAAWVGTGIGKKLRTCLPAQIRQYPSDGSLKFIVLIDTPASRRPLLPPVKDAINKELAGRVRLFGVQHVTLVDFDAARRIGLPVEKQA